MLGCFKTQIVQTELFANRSNVKEITFGCCFQILGYLVFGDLFFRFHDSSRGVKVFHPKSSGLEYVSCIDGLVFWGASFKSTPPRPRPIIALQCRFDAENNIHSLSPPIFRQPIGLYLSFAGGFLRGFSGRVSGVCVKRCA